MLKIFIVRRQLISALSHYLHSLRNLLPRHLNSKLNRFLCTVCSKGNEKYSKIKVATWKIELFKIIEEGTISSAWLIQIVILRWWTFSEFIKLVEKPEENIQFEKSSNRENQKSRGELTKIKYIYKSSIAGMETETLLNSS